MPTFDYRCEKCKTIEEITVQRYDEVQHCAECEEPMKKLVSGRISVVYHCDGFAHQSLAADRHQQMVKECEEEGFTSQMEVETAMEQGIQRAQERGIDPRKIVGKSTYESGCVPSWEDELEKVM